MIICKKNFRIVNKSYKFGHANFDYQAEDSLKINECKPGFSLSQNIKISLKFFLPNKPDY